MRELGKLGIQYNGEESPFYTTCPKCAEKRSKGGSKSLQVFINEDNATFKCYHSKQCEWNNMQLVSLKTKHNKVESTEEYKYIPIDKSKEKEIRGMLKSYSAVYEYFSGGKLMFFIARKEATADSKKVFHSFAVNTSGEIISRRPHIKALYRSEFLTDDPSRRVVVVEGEKAADAAAKLFPNSDVVSWAGGSESYHMGDWELLKGRTVCLWPDNDEAGISAMKAIANLIPSMKIEMVDVTPLPKGADLADNLGQDTINTLLANRKSVVQLPAIKGVMSISSYHDALRKVTTGLGMGWEHMDKTLVLPQSGLVVFEGRSGHGKTSGMLNVACNLLRKTTRPILYFSYEIPAVRTLTKLLMIMENTTLNKVPYVNEEMYRDAMLEGGLKSAKELEGYLGSRLFMTDYEYTISELVAVLDTPAFEGAIVLVDYIQLIPTTSKDNRYLIIKDFADKLRSIGNKRGQVIITGSQLTNGETPFQDQAREGKDIMNAAELVIKIWNKDVAEAHDCMESRGDEKKGTDPKHYYHNVAGNIIFDVKKNRNGKVGQQYGFNLVNGAKFDEQVTIFKEF